MTGGFIEFASDASPLIYRRIWYGWCGAFVVYLSFGFSVTISLTAQPWIYRATVRRKKKHTTKSSVARACSKVRRNTHMCHSFNIVLTEYFDYAIYTKEPYTRKTGGHAWLRILPTFLLNHRRIQEIQHRCTKACRWKTVIVPLPLSLSWFLVEKFVVDDGWNRTQKWPFLSVAPRFAWGNFAIKGILSCDIPFIAMR